ncbi:uncharacterized protein LOC135093675 [Scylla paramamosain]|uniref:uncharacterized protein LOC135093675 n=1 Tax=Scylla paramamosain TaxID=85552 RepID=UPI0030834EF6
MTAHIPPSPQCLPSPLHHPTTCPLPCTLCRHRRRKCSTSPLPPHLRPWLISPCLLPPRPQFTMPPPREPPPLPPPTTQLNFHPPLPPGPLPPSQIPHRLPQPPPQTPPPPPLPCTPPPLPPTTGYQGQPPLPPLPPPPTPQHKPDVSKLPPPPLPKDPPPLPEAKKTTTTPNTLPATAPPLPKLPFPTTHAAHTTQTKPKKPQEETERPKPIPSIITPRPSFTKVTTTTTLTTGARVTCNTTAPTREDTPSPPINAPSPDEDDDPIPSADLSSDDAYDPEDPMFSPSYDSDSPSPKEDSVDSLIDKYVRRLGNAHPSIHKSSTSSTLAKKSSRHHRHREKRKKSSHASVSPPSTPSPTKGEKVAVGSSPARPNLDARLKIMFGGTPVTQKEKRVKDKAKRKLKKSLKQFPRPPTPPNTQPTSSSTTALPPSPAAMAPQPPASLPPPTPITTTATTTTAQPDDDFERPLSPTPSPFLSRHMYLYWHRETLRARRGSVETKTKTTQAQTKPQINGQALVTSPLKATIPPLPKNLPTVPPPNYRAPMAPPAGKPVREPSLKAEIMRNITRMHPYKSSDGQGHGVRPNADAELEISSEVSGEEQEEAMEGVVEVETVRLVLDRIVEELKHALRQHLTKDLVDTRVSVCFEGTDGDS